MKKAMFRAMVLLTSLVLCLGITAGCGGGGGSDDGGGGGVKKYTATGTYDFPAADPGVNCPDGPLLHIVITASNFPLDCGPEQGWDEYAVVLTLEAFHMLLGEFGNTCGDFTEWDRLAGGAADDLVGTWKEGSYTITFEDDGTVTMTGPKDCG